MEQEPRIRISVRNLVEFILRSGDIDNRRGGYADKEAMQEGSRIHRKIQGKMGSNYQAEVVLSMDIPGDGYTLTVEGRADGIFHENSGAKHKTTEYTDLSSGETGAGVYIDEIKGMYRDVLMMEKPMMIHLAQAKCYAYIYAKQKELTAAGVQMTYCSLETEEIRRFRLTYTLEELETWFLDLTGQYQKWARHQLEWKQIRQASIRQLTFPFAWRKGQKEVASSVYRTMLREKKLFIQAPTGTGKTISTIFPAVKAVGEGLAEQIFYATAKTITRTVAEETYTILRNHGLRMKTVTLTAKEKICFCEEAD